MPYDSNPRSAPVQADRRFSAMGSRARVLVVGGPDDLPDRLKRRIRELEHLWSRFIPTSEVCRLNRAGGAAMPVSPETMQLLSCAIGGWEATFGLFDPTMLDDLERAGYDRTFADLQPTQDQPPEGHATADEPAVRRSWLERDTCGIEINAETGLARLATGVSFDPGGIGKGLATDLIADEALASGASGVLVDLGGDVRVAGRPPALAPCWSIDIDDPFGGSAIGTVDLDEGAVATSSRLKRHWSVGDETRHHLIDPRVGRPVSSDVAAVTVVAALGWQAEVLAKAAFVGGPVQGLGLVDQLGGTALLIDEHGHQIPGHGWNRYARHPGGTTGQAGRTERVA